jgi:hypothetical protein
MGAGLRISNERTRLHQQLRHFELSDADRAIERRSTVTISRADRSAGLQQRLHVGGAHDRQMQRRRTVHVRRLDPYAQFQDPRTQTGANSLSAHVQRCPPTTISLSGIRTEAHQRLESVRPVLRDRQVKRRRRTGRRSMRIRASLQQSFDHTN